MCLSLRISVLRMIIIVLFLVFVTLSGAQQQNCTATEDCNDVLAKCEDFKCTCVENAELDLDIAACSCIEGYSDKDKNCMKDPEGPPRPMPCDLPRHCVSLLGVHSKCIKRNCFCIEGAKYSDTGKLPTCFKTQHEINGKCESDSECQIKSSKCRKNVCQCSEDFVESPDGNCVGDVKILDGECKFDIQCNKLTLGQGVLCLNNKCDCNEEYRRVEKHCFHKASIGASCERNENCNHIKNARCAEDTCVCMKGYTTKPNASHCLEVAKSFKTPCEQDSQCSEGLGDKAVCTNHLCDCADIYKYDPKSEKCEEVTLKSGTSKYEDDSPNTLTLDSKVATKTRDNSVKSSSNKGGSLFDKHFSHKFIAFLITINMLMKCMF